MKRRVASLLGALVLLTSAVMMAGCPQSAKPDIRKYKITLNQGEHGTVTVDPVLPKDGMVAQYAKLTFTATPDEGYELAGWTGATPDNADIHKATLTVAADATITATFKKKPEIKKYKITLNQGEHGTVTVDPVLPKDGMVAQYAKLTFTATPDKGYELAGWTGATPDNADIHKATLTVAADATITATFKKKPEIKKYKITLNQGEHGTVTVDPVLPKDGMVAQYAKLTFTATPDKGYELAGWTGATPDNADIHKATLTVAADATITATFKKKPEIKKYKITLNQGEHGTVNVDPPLPADGIIAKDTVLTFTAIPDTGYEVAAWTGATQDSADKNKARLTVTAHTTVSVTFKEKTADVSLLQIDSTGRLTGVTDRNALVGSLAIPNTVTKIGVAAFAHCTNLTGITIPDSVTEIGNNAFSNCSALSAVTIGNNVTKIGHAAFEHCTNLTGITIPDSVTEIGNSAFSDCSALSAVTIGTGVTKIGRWAFKYCTNLTGIAIPDSVTEIGDSAFSDCSALSAVTIGTGVTKIGQLVFIHCTNLTGITIPNSVTEIGNLAFSNCSALSAVTIGTGVTKIGQLAFAHCTNLTGITIPDSVTEIGNSAFSDCSALSTVTIGNNVTKIGHAAFDHCTNLTGITIPNSVTEIGNIAFLDCSALSAVTIGNNVTKIGDGAFAHCTNLTGITIPDSVTEIGDGAFSNCSALSAVTIGAGVTKIGGEAFARCTNLTGITIPDSVTEIELAAFIGCETLTRAVFKAPSGWKVLSKDGNTTENINQADLEDTSKAATYLRDTYWEYTWQKQ
ncbi:leucine-rich repeat domain-containing protein [Treponema vincentii]|uniref:leucine-rich repeat protein n=1 Tax=Treponema vincentii TaxID=69710 RepID=UPI001BB053B8|nr:leucine-rich repeat protein [Treponema vincentii]QUY18395.1 leucine-rich repeat domain-containing protein [Treponema vincentii]